MFGLDFVSLQGRAPRGAAWCAAAPHARRAGVRAAAPADCRSSYHSLLAKEEEEWVAVQGAGPPTFLVSYSRKWLAMKVLACVLNRGDTDSNSKSV
jgi:hypothetical protein